MEIDIWQYLVPALSGILSGVLVPIVLNWRNKRAEAKRIEADRRTIEEDITERVLTRAREEINGLVLENEELRNRIRDVIEEKEALTCRVNKLEEQNLLMQAEYDKLFDMFDKLRVAFNSVCNQLNRAGIKPEVEFDGLNEQFKR